MFLGCIFLFSMSKALIVPVYITSITEKNTLGITISKIEITEEWNESDENEQFVYVTLRQDGGYGIPEKERSSYEQVWIESDFIFPVILEWDGSEYRKLEAKCEISPDNYSLMVPENGEVTIKYTITGDRILTQGKKYCFVQRIIVKHYINQKEEAEKAVYFDTYFIECEFILNYYESKRYFY